MACTNFNNCKSQEVNNIGFPADKDSLYAKKIYDTQTAASRCYANAPRGVNIVEGFGSSFTLEGIIKFGIIVLLIILFISLICDYSTKEITLMKGGADVATESFFELTALSILGEQ